MAAHVVIGILYNIARRASFLARFGLDIIPNSALKKNHLAIIGALALGPFLLRCAKDDPALPSPKPCVVDSTSSTVYVAGTETKPDATGRSANYAVYWKNGHEIMLTDGLSNAHAYGIAVSATDVYVVGVVERIATCWKNGVPESLSESISVARAVAISGSDVYVGGNVLEEGHILAVYWKNGNPVMLSDTLNESQATSIAVAGNDVYVSGNIILNGHSVAKYWKNGESVNLSDTAKVDATTSSLFVSGTDIYVAGQEIIHRSTTPARIATYWKNGTPVLLSNGIHDTSALSIAVTGNGVAVVGYERYNDISNSIAVYWTNGYELTVSGNTGKYISYAMATSIFATGDNVYVAVQETDQVKNSSIAKYWRDGCSINLNNGTTSTIDLNSIFVIK